MPHCIFLLHHSRFMAQHAQALHSKYQLYNKETMLSTALGFSIGKIVTDHCSILTIEAASFFPRAAATMSLTQVVKKCRNKSY